VASARQVAWEVLHAVDTRGAYADRALENRLRRGPQLGGQARRLATELAYGAVRRLNTLDWALSSCMKRPLDKCDAWVRAALRLGAYQLLYLDAVPGPVAVDETVRLLGHGPPWLGGLVNAVLRRLCQERDRLVYPDPVAEPVRHLALVHSHPEWVVENFLARLGWEETVDLCRWNNRPPRITVRVNTSRLPVAEFTQALAASGVQWKPGLYHPAAVELVSPGCVPDLPGYAEGHFVVQDEGSMLAVSLLAPQDGERVLDACAAPGGKAAHLAELVGKAGLVIANDVNPGRLKLVQETKGRLGLEQLQLLQRDAGRLDGAVACHRVLLDAPCSGLGVLSRRPDARWRKAAQDIAALAALQADLLEGASSCVMPGGVLVYSVCTLTEPEGPGVVTAFLEKHPQFRLDSPRPYLPAGLESAVTGPGFVELWPQRHGTDGFFMARLVRAKEESPPRARM
jgi:16S rRNA (cytosine967-C5)-methyltransferase